MNSEIINDKEYRFNKLDALAQFHIVRRLAPIVNELLIAFGPQLGKMKSSPTPDLSEVDFDKLAKDIEPVVLAFSKLSDDDANYVLFGLLKGVVRKSEVGGWSPVVNPGAQMLQFQDIEMPTMLTLAGKAMVVNLSGFIDALPSGLKEAAVKGAASNG